MFDLFVIDWTGPLTDHCDSHRRGGALVQTETYCTLHIPWLCKLNPFSRLALDDICLDVAEKPCFVFCDRQKQKVGYWKAETVLPGVQYYILPVCIQAVQLLACLHIFIKAQFFIKPLCSFKTYYFNIYRFWNRKKKCLVLEWCRHIWTNTFHKCKIHRWEGLKLNHSLLLCILFFF